jgi:uncharacterized protein
VPLFEIDDVEQRGVNTWLRPGLQASGYEVTLILAVVIGYSMFNSTWQALHGSSHHYVNDLLSDGRMMRTMAIEGAMLAALFLWLGRRGWTPADLRIKPGVKSSLLGIGLLVAMVLANTVTVAVLFLLDYQLRHHGENVLAFLGGNSPHIKPHSVEISWIALVPAMVLNAYFEEITCMAYGFNQFAARWGPYVALPIIVVLRMSCHTYQGLFHAMGIGVVFTIEGLVYWRTRNLWPLIFAHMLLDLFSVSFMKVFFGH